MTMKDNISTPEKEQTIQQLLAELEKGRKSGETEGWLTLEEVEKHFHEKLSE